MHIYENVPREHLTVVISRYNENIDMFERFKHNIILYNKGNDEIPHWIDRNFFFQLENLGREGGTYLYHIINNYDNLSEYTIFTQADPVDHVAVIDPHATAEHYCRIFEEPKNYGFKYISTHFIPVIISECSLYVSGIPHTPIELGNPKNLQELINQLTEWISNNSNNDLEGYHNNLLPSFNELINQGKETIMPYEFLNITKNNNWYLHHFCNNNNCTDYILKCFDYSYFQPHADNGYTFGYGALFIVHKSHIHRRSKEWWIRIFNEFQHPAPGAGWGMEKLWRYVLE